MAEKINLIEKLSKFQEHWTPKIVADFNDCDVRVAKFKGPFMWHSHTETDEMFLVVSGKLVLEFRDGVKHLDPGEFIVIPKGVEHRTSSPEECQVMILAKKETRNTGDLVNEKTVIDLERI